MWAILAHQHSVSLSIIEQIQWVNKAFDQFAVDDGIIISRKKSKISYNGLYFYNKKKIIRTERWVMLFKTTVYLSSFEEKKDYSFSSLYHKTIILNSESHWFLSVSHSLWNPCLLKTIWPKTSAQILNNLLTTVRHRADHELTYTVFCTWLWVRHAVSEFLATVMTVLKLFWVSG